MGVIYRLKPDIRDFVLQKKQENLRISCRDITKLVKDNFNLTISKSSINFLLKNQGLSLPIGRRNKSEGIIKAYGLGVFLLKAADAMLGGVNAIVTFLRQEKGLQETDLFEKTECLLYLSLFSKSVDLRLEPVSGLWAVINKRLSDAEIRAYLTYLEGVRVDELYRCLLETLKFCSYLKLTFDEGISIYPHTCKPPHQNLWCGGKGVGVYLDGKFHTTWQNSSIPATFSIPVYKVKSYLKEIQEQNKPWVLFMAPDDERILFQQNPKIEAILYNSKAEEVGRVSLVKDKNWPLIFGLWPWQMSSLRKIVQIGHFKRIYLKYLKKEFYLAETEVIFTQLDENKKVKLKGCALKTQKDEQIQVIILKNEAMAGLSIEELAKIYLYRWPKLSQHYYEFKEKMCLFTYLSDYQEVTPIEEFIQKTSIPSNLRELLDLYLATLDLYVQWQFLGAAELEFDFVRRKAILYSLPAKILPTNEGVEIKFRLSSAQQFLKKILQNACQCINTSEIKLFEKKRLWCNLG